MKRIFCLSALSVCLVCGQNANAAGVSLDWTASVSPAVVGYHVYFGATSGSYPNKVDAGNATTVTISNLVPGVIYYFAATACDAAGNESGYSSEVSYAVPGLTLSRSANSGNPLVLQFPVTAGSWYEVQASTDLQHWATIWQTTAQLADTSLQFVDPAAAFLNSRFYRLVRH